MRRFPSKFETRVHPLLGASIGRWRPLCNGTQRTLLLALCTFIFLGCQEDEKPVEETKKTKTSAQKKEADRRHATAVPIPPIELFKLMPDTLPAGIAVGPGGSVEALKKLRPKLKPSPYSDKWLIDEANTGPFRTIQYQLKRDKKTVYAVMGIFHDAYDTKERREALVDSIEIRLGKAKKFSDAKHEGHRWRQIDYRVEVRKDKKDKALEFVLHTRGQVDPTADPDK